MKKVIFDEEVESDLNELVNILYKEEYFGLKSSAYDYVGWIIDNIVQNVSTTPHKLAPPYFARYGQRLYYSVFKRNNNTQWYVFFNMENDIFYIRYIGNNHTCAQYIE